MDNIKVSSLHKIVWIKHILALQSVSQVMIFNAVLEIFHNW